MNGSRSLRGRAFATTSAPDLRLNASLLSMPMDTSHAAQTGETVIETQDVRGIHPDTMYSKTCSAELPCCIEFVCDCDRLIARALC